MATPKVTISLLNRFNWESAAALELHPHQKEFLPDNLFSIAQSKFENLLPYGIMLEEKLVGFLMYGNFGRICWISRIMVDKAYQKQGIGAIALQIILDKLERNPVCSEIRTSFSRKNTLAATFFAAQGFHKLSDDLENEIVMRYQP
ncbi:MAG TPA: GNAT family N-acetyltransferase [Bacteroidetes bacterium]|nr:GNAT family N-acetyltransferase [Bacteroidota bacterium]